MAKEPIGASTAFAVSAAPPPSQASYASTNAPAWALPDGCSLVQPSSTFAIALCQPKPEPISSKLINGLPATVISLLALGLSLWTLTYNRRKDAQARRQSIEDDFWLRKVVSPLSIEPFLKHAHELVATLPAALGSTKQSVSEFWSAQAAKFGEFNIVFRALGLMDPQLAAQVVLEIEKIEDELAQYCGNLGQHLDGSLPNAPDRDAASQKLIAMTIGVFQLIKVHQTSVGIGK